MTDKPEITQAMINAGSLASEGWAVENLSTDCMRDIYQAMRALEPAPPATPLMVAAEAYRHAMETFADAVRAATGTAYPWEAQGISRDALDKALSTPRDFPNPAAEKALNVLLQNT